MTLNNNTWRRFCIGLAIIQYTSSAYPWKGGGGAFSEEVNEA